MLSYTLIYETLTSLSSKMNHFEREKGLKAEKIGGLRLKCIPFTWTVIPIFEEEQISNNIN